MASVNNNSNNANLHDLVADKEEANFEAAIAMSLRVSFVVIYFIYIYLLLLFHIGSRYVF